MLMGISIWILLIGLFILIWDRAASSNIWGADMKVSSLRSYCTLAPAKYFVSKFNTDSSYYIDWGLLRSPELRVKLHLCMAHEQRLV